MKKLVILFAVLLWLTVFSASSLAVTVDWSANFNGKFNGNDFYRGIAKDKQGNIYVVGTVQKSSSNFAILVRKFLPDGRLVFHKVFDPSPAQDSGYGITLDNQGNIYIAGFKTRPTNNTDIWLVKLNPQGKRVWRKVINGPGNGNDAAYSLAVMKGQLAVVGSVKTKLKGVNGWLAVFDLSGRKLWARSFNGKANSHDYLTSVAFGPDTNIYIAGTVTTSLTPKNQDIYLAKFTPDGRKVWSISPTDTGTDFDQALGIAIRDKFFYVSGILNGKGPIYGQGFINRYNFNGQLIWSRNFSTPYQNSYGSAVTIDKLGSAYIVGSVVRDSRDIIVKKYTADGAEAWTDYYDSSLGDYGFGVTIANYRVYVSGYFRHPQQGLNGFLRKYSQ